MSATPNRRRFLTGAAAYATGAAAVTGVAALASEAKGATIVNPLDPFARGWLAEWTSRGGSFLRGPGDQWTCGWLDYFSLSHRRTREAMRTDSPWLESFGHEQRERILLEREGTYRDNHDGAMRALFDVLHATEGGPEAVKALCAASPQLGFHRQEG